MPQSSSQTENDLCHGIILTFWDRRAIINIQKSGAGKVSLHRSFFPDAMFIAYDTNIHDPIEEET